MRNPVQPIPSPHCGGVAQTYWDGRPPPPVHTASQGGPPVAVDAGTTFDHVDPLSFLHGRGDLLGIDRRHAPRTIAADGEESIRGTGVSAAHHIRTRAVIGLRSQFGWALVDAVALAPAGLLVRNLDLLDPEIDVEERKRGRAAFMHIEALLSRRTLKSAPEGSSMLAAVGRCLLGSRVVADLSTWVRSSHHPTDGRLQVTLLVTTPQSKSRAHSGTSEQPGERPAERPPELVDLGLCEIDGRVCPLTDPYDDVLAIGLTSSARTKLAGALQRRGDLCA